MSSRTWSLLDINMKMWKLIEIIQYLSGKGCQNGDRKKDNGVTFEGSYPIEKRFLDENRSC